MQEKLLHTKNLTFQMEVEMTRTFESTGAIVESPQIEEGTTVNKVRVMRSE